MDIALDIASCLCYFIQDYDFVPILVHTDIIFSPQFCFGPLIKIHKTVYTTQIPAKSVAFYESYAQKALTKECQLSLP